MSSSTTSGQGQGDEAPDLVCVVDCVHGMVDALSCVRWNKHQVSSRPPSPLLSSPLLRTRRLYLRAALHGMVVELSEHGIVVTVEESGCLQAKVYLKTELFAEYNYGAEGRPRFGLSLGLFVDCLNMFTVPGFASPVEIRYPGPDMQLLLRSVGSPDACIHAEIRTRIPDTVAWDYHFEHAGNTPVTFTVKSAILKESIDDLEWPGSSIQIQFHPDPPSVIFKGEGHGDLEIEFSYYANTDLLIAFQCDQELSYRYKYKFLRATTSNVPSSVLKENRGSKVTIGRGGMLKIQHLVSVARLGEEHDDGSD
ncbi:hypothetical protein ACQJBY_062232 [Aegilops geniculata]